MPEGSEFLLLCQPRSVLCSLPFTQALRFQDYRWLHIANFLFCHRKGTCGLHQSFQWPSRTSHSSRCHCGLSSRSRASCWLWCDTPALCTGGTQFQLPNFALCWALPAQLPSRANPPGGSAVGIGRGRMQESDGHPCIPVWWERCTAIMSRAVSCPPSGTGILQQRNNSFTLCSSKAWAPQIESSKTPSKQK